VSKHKIKARFIFSYYIDCDLHWLYFVCWMDDAFASFLHGE